MALSIEDLNLNIPEENKNDTEHMMLNSNLEELRDMKKSKKTVKKKKKKQITMIDSKVSNVSTSSKKKLKAYDYSPLTQKKDKMPNYNVPEEVLKLQTDQTKIFNNYHINPTFELRPDEYNDLIVPPLKKPNLWKRVFCCEAKLKISKWLLDGDNISLSGDTYKSVKHIDLAEFDDQAMFKKLFKLYKAAPKLENLTINVLTDFELNHFLEVIQKVLTSSNQFDVCNQIKISSLPHESLLWVGPQFIHSHFVMPFYNIVPKIDPWVEIRHVFRKYIDKGARKEEIVQLINFALKKFEKNTDLQLLHLKFSCWSELGDEVVRAASAMIWKLGFNLRELVVHFCGRKLTDYGVQEICETIVALKNKKLLAIGFGFDSRNLEITDNSLKKISETFLAVSQNSYLRSISVSIVSQPISDYGLWCLGHCLQKIAERLNNVVILIASIAAVSDKGIQDVIEGVLRCGKNLRSVTIGFLSWEISKYGLRVIEGNVALNSLNLELFNLYFSNQGFECKEREENLKAVIMGKHKSMSDCEIHIFLR